MSISKQGGPNIMARYKRNIACPLLILCPLVAYKVYSPTGPVLLVGQLA